MSAPATESGLAAALPFVRRTPLLFAPPLGCWLKLESLQRTGSFKLRGAARKLLHLPRPGGVVTASAGNHGQGVALAARHLGLAATVVVPRLCPSVKREAIAHLGAEVRVEGEHYEAAEEAARTLAAARGLPFVSPFDDDEVIAGNGGWVGRELIEQHPGLKRVVAPVGGGGLVAGLLEALPAIEVVGVQPCANCAMYDSLAIGRALVRYEGGPTLCEGLEGPVAERTYAVARARRLAITRVDEEAILLAVGYCWRVLGLAVEPSAAVTTAAVRQGLLTVDDATALVITGGNVDPELLDRAIAAYDRLNAPAPRSAPGPHRR